MWKNYMKWDQENMLMSSMKSKSNKKIKKLKDHKNKSKKKVKHNQIIVLIRKNRKC